MQLIIIFIKIAIKKRSSLNLSNTTTFFTLFPSFFSTFFQPYFLTCLQIRLQTLTLFWSFDLFDRIYVSIPNACFPNALIPISQNPELQFPKLSDSFFFFYNLNSHSRLKGVSQIVRYPGGSGLLYSGLRHGRDFCIREIDIREIDVVYTWHLLNIFKLKSRCQEDLLLDMNSGLYEFFFLVAYSPSKCRQLNIMT